MKIALKDVSVECGEGEEQIQILVRLNVDIHSRLVETERVRKNA
jgi:hypothetical protein